MLREPLKNIPSNLDRASLNTETMKWALLLLIIFFHGLAPEVHMNTAGIDGRSAIWIWPGLIGLLSAANRGLGLGR
jgi:hypothetical protein